jgi:predicted ATPase
VTALGPGGTGKTRLALTVAADLAGEFADGVWFVDLVPVTDAEMTGAAVARALGSGEQQGRSLDDSVLTALADPLRLLVGGRRGDDRHRSMRALLDWSQALLEEPDRCPLRRVAVFVAPFTAADAVMMTVSPRPVSSCAVAQPIPEAPPNPSGVGVGSRGVGTRHRFTDNHPYRCLVAGVGFG